MGVSVSIRQFHRMAQNITYSPWGGTKGIWLCLMSTLSLLLLLFGLDCFPLFLHFLTSVIKLILWLKFFHRQKAAGDMGVRDQRVMLHFSIIFIYIRGNRTEQAWPRTFTQHMAKSRFSIRLPGFRLQDSVYYRRLSLLYTGVYLMNCLLH